MAKRRRRNPTAKDSVRALVVDGWSAQYIVECLIDSLLHMAEELRAEEPEDAEADVLESDAWELKRVVSKLDPGG